MRGWIYAVQTATRSMSDCLYVPGGTDTKTAVAHSWIYAGSNSPQSV